MKFLKLLSPSAFVLAAALAGCADTQYAADPVNPKTPFVFPGQTPNAQAAPQPGLPQTATPLPPVAVNPSIMPVTPSTMPPQPSSTVLRAQDRIIVSFADIPQPPPAMEIRIPEDGSIVLPFNITMKAIGKTANQLQEEIRQAYVPTFFKRLTVNIKTEDRFYFVGGEVRMPNQKIYASEMTVLRAIDTVGGFTEFANRKKIELRRANGQKHMINWHKAIKDPLKYDLAVYPNDQITVHKRFW